MNKEQEPLYRVIFTQQEELYEVYAKYISEDHLVGFIELEELVFTDTKSTLLVDPSEEKLKSEFQGVKRCYIPMYNILRIDEVERLGAAKIKPSDKAMSNVSPFPKVHRQPTKGESE